MTLRANLAAFVSGMAGVLVGAAAFGGVAYATGAASLLLGKTNKETVTTVLANAKGTPLSLVGKAGVAPLKVSNGVKVTNLNADKLDNLDSSAFARVTGTVANATNAANANALGGKAASAFALSTAQSGYVSSNTYYEDTSGSLVPDLFFADATCPEGTILTSGGAYTSGENALYEVPVGSNTWEVGALTGPVRAYAICVNLNGAVPTGIDPTSAGAHTTSTHRALFGR